MALRTALMALRAVLMASCFALLSGLQACANAGEPMVLPTDGEPLLVSTAKGDMKLSVEIAVSETEHQRGLMYRGRLADGHGMLFVMAETEPVMFWMQNTPSALDLVFIEENGRIAAIKRGEPLSQAIIPSEKPVRFVLEIAAGEAARLGLAPGDEFRHPVIKAISGQ
jgi:uncharacterized protein